MIKRFFILLLSISILLFFFEYVVNYFHWIHINLNILNIGTIILAVISSITFLIAFNSSVGNNPNKFVRGVMVSTFLKFALCVIVVAIYILVEKKNVNKFDLFFLMFVYLIYTVFETVFLSTIVRKDK